MKRGSLYPIALRKAKIVKNFGLSEWNRVKEYLLLRMQILSKGGRKNGEVASPKSVSIHKYMNINKGNTGAAYIRL